MNEVIELIRILAWPAVVLSIAVGFRKTLTGLLNRTRKISYGKLDLQFGNQVRKIISSTVSELPLEKVKTEISPTEAIASPAERILNAWHSMEFACRRKADELVPIEGRHELFQKDPVMYIAYSGALGPSLSDALAEVKTIIDQITHEEAFSPKANEVDSFLSFIQSLTTAIEAIRILPTARLHALTYVILEISSLIDTGKFDNISLEEMEQVIKEKRVLTYLKELAPNHVDLSLIIGDSPYPGFAKYYHEQLADILDNYGGNERRKWGIERRGLCLLLSWTNEIIQRGKGWFHQ